MIGHGTLIALQAVTVVMLAGALWEARKARRRLKAMLSVMRGVWSELKL